MLTGNPWPLPWRPQSCGSDKLGHTEQQRHLPLSQGLDRGVGGQHERGDVSPSRPKLPNPSWLICIYFAFICMPLSGSGPHSSAIASPLFPGFLFFH